jgi:hypothetical protein
MKIIITDEGQDDFTIDNERLDNYNFVDIRYGIQASLTVPLDELHAAVIAFMTIRENNRSSE